MDESQVSESEEKAHSKVNQIPNSQYWNNNQAPQHYKKASTEGQAKNQSAIDPVRDDPKGVQVANQYYKSNQLERRPVSQSQIS